jgi:hypothetical protein
MPTTLLTLLRKLSLICAAVAAFAVAGALSAPRAEALPLSAPAALNTALAENNLLESVAYYCRRVWRCGPYGCGWRRVCGWRGPAYYGGYYGPGYYPGWRWGYYRPYRYGWGWRRRW